MMGWGYGWYPRQMTMAEKRERAARQTVKLGKKHGLLDPVILESRRIASSWWGIHWNENLERYADFAYRLDRGRSYVRHGMVLDLKIEPGLVRAKVAGSRSTPYDVTIKIKPLPGATWKALVRKASGHVESIGRLLNGGFPEALKDLFFMKAGGLFPTPKEIDLDCSCPDWADMCKHVAATLYGVGARLDRQPALFFSLRGVKMEDLVGKATSAAATALLDKAAKPSAKGRRILKADVNVLFGVSVESNTSAPATAHRRTVTQTDKPTRQEKQRKKWKKPSPTIRRIKIA